MFCGRGFFASTTYRAVCSLGPWQKRKRNFSPSILVCPRVSPLRNGMAPDAKAVAAREQQGIEAWMKWVHKHEKNILDVGPRPAWASTACPSKGHVEGAQRAHGLYDRRGRVSCGSRRRCFINIALHDFSGPSSTIPAPFDSRDYRVNLQEPRHHHEQSTLSMIILGIIFFGAGMAASFRPRPTAGPYAREHENLHDRHDGDKVFLSATEGHGKALCGLMF